MTGTTRFRLTAALLAMSCWPSGAPAAKDPPPRPALFQQLVDCRAIADNAARLTCYDAQVAKLDEAERASDVVVVDRAEIKKARKGLFGLSLPDLGSIFGGKKDGDPEPELTEIESTVRAAAIGAGGKLTVIIADGARWVQTDTKAMRVPKAGTPVKIRKAAMGSFFMNIDDRPGIKVMRQN